MNDDDTDDDNGKDNGEMTKSSSSEYSGRFRSISEEITVVSSFSLMLNR